MYELKIRNEVLQTGNAVLISKIIFVNQLVEFEQIIVYMMKHINLKVGSFWFVIFFVA